jgi:hypothetical protein
VEKESTVRITIGQNEDSMDVKSSIAIGLSVLAVRSEGEERMLQDLFGGTIAIIITGTTAVARTVEKGASPKISFCRYFVSRFWRGAKYRLTAGQKHV